MPGTKGITFRHHHHRPLNCVIIKATPHTPTHTHKHTHTREKSPNWLSENTLDLITHIFKRCQPLYVGQPLKLQNTLNLLCSTSFSSINSIVMPKQVICVKQMPKKTHKISHTHTPYNCQGLTSESR